MIAIRQRMLIVLFALTLCFSAQGVDAKADVDDFRLIELKVDTLPSLNVARAGHATLCLNGELTVFGGHTDGFVPTATAEYLCNGVWQTVPLVYPHDHAIVLGLRSGKAFLAGGHREPLGIGQLFSAELYDPASHTSQGFGCMDRKRAYANAIEMDDGQVVIAGNWFADDGIEMFANINDPFKPNAVNVKDASIARAKPYILRISDDDAIVFGSLSNGCEPIDGSIVDRLKGASYRELFLDAWSPMHAINIQRSYNQFIGNEDEGRYEWLLPVENNKTGRIAIARVKGVSNGVSKPTFSLLSTQRPIPDSINGKHIIYSSLVCDRERGLAYLIGDNDEARVFVVAIPYDTDAPAPLTIYVTEPQHFIARNISPALTSEGDLVFAGGALINNFSPSDLVVRLPLSRVNGSGNADSSSAHGDTHGSVWWLWIIIPFLIICVAVAIFVMRRKPESRQTPICEPASTDDAEETPIDKNTLKEETLLDLFKRIELLMEEERLYLDPNLRTSNVASRVGSNTAYVSAAINSQCGCSFTQYLTSYRISYAQQLLRQNPDRKISEVSALSGFSTDSTFFRAFRSVTGMTPKEWLSERQDNQSHQDDQPAQG